MKNIGIILAGGSGKRLGDNIPKQLLKLAGKRVIEHTIAVFQNHELIDEIAVISHPDYIRDIEQISINNSFSKLKKILKGGEERYLSSIAAINAYNDETNLIFHDSVRPLVNERIITDCIIALSKYNAVDVAIPTTDTIIEVNDKDEIISVPPRSHLRNGQTPQAFKWTTIKNAYDIALQDSNFKTTDDCGVVLKYLPEEPIYVVNGELFNMKLTYKEDLFLLDKLFQIKSIDGTHFLIDNLYSKLPKKVIVIFGGNSGIGCEIKNMSINCNAHVYSFSRSLDGVNITNVDSVRSALKNVFEREGKIDFVINTAGILDKQPLNNMTYDEIFESININYMGSVIVAKESFQYLKSTRGCLLLFTSSSYTRGRSLYSIYSSTKAAIVNFVQAMSEEWYDYGVRINCINPERCNTPMRRKNFGSEPKDSLLDPIEVATVSLNALISNMTGEIIDVKKKR